MFDHGMRRADSRNRRHKAAEEHVSVALRLAYWGLRRSCGTVPLTSARGLSFPSTTHARAHKTGCRAHTIPAATIQGTKDRIRTQMAHTSGTNSEKYKASSWRESVALGLFEFAEAIWEAPAEGIDIARGVQVLDALAQAFRELSGRLLPELRHQCSGPI